MVDLIKEFADSIDVIEFTEYSSDYLEVRNEKSTLVFSIDSERLAVDVIGDLDVLDKLKPFIEENKDLFEEIFIDVSKSGYSKILEDIMYGYNRTQNGVYTYPNFKTIISNQHPTAVISEVKIANAFAINMMLGRNLLTVFCNANRIKAIGDINQIKNTINLLNDIVEDK